MNNRNQLQVAAPPAGRNELVDLLLFVVKLAFAVALFRAFVFAPYSIPSESMMPRLLVGDYVIVAKWPYGWSRHSLPLSAPLIPGRFLARLPERGDVIVLKEPPDARVDVIKRVIGLPGDRVQLRGGQVFLNGSPLPQRHQPDLVLPTVGACLPGTLQAGTTCRYARLSETLPSGRRYDLLALGKSPSDDTQDYIVPPGQLFVLGDNRGDSMDSRLEAGGFGFVPLDNVVGRAQFVAFSTDGTATWWKPWTWMPAIRWSRIGGGF